MNDNKKVGFFDSGVGGLTVLKEVLKICPNLNIVYFGDNKNAPYGQKSQSEIIELTKSAFKFLKEKKCNKIVTACNSVSAVVNEKLAVEVGIERQNIIEMSAPTVRHCVENNLENILVLSTEATKKLALYTEQFLEEGMVVDSVAINGLVDFIENGGSDTEKENIILEQLLGVELIKYQNIILACTHFPLVENIFKKVFQNFSTARAVEKLNFINPAVFVAEEVLKKFGNEGNGENIFRFSKNSKITEKFVKEVLE